MAINYALPKPVAGTPRAGEEVSLMVDVSDTVADIDTRITTEASDRATGDADTLAAANTYTDTAVDNATSSLWLPATILQSLTGSPARSNIATFAVWLLDAASDEFVGSVILPPPDWTTYNVTLYWTVSSGSGDCVWTSYSKGAGDGVSLSGADWSVAATATAPSAGVMEVTPIATGQAASASPAKFVISRDADNAADTLTTDAALVGALLEKAS